MKTQDRIPARLLAAGGALILAASLLAGGLSWSAAGVSPDGPARDAATFKIVSANVSGGYSCDSTEWHFVITQTSDAQAPATITVTWANGASIHVLLGSVTGGTAHYTTTANLDSQVTAAIATIADDWIGGFQLSHGPCLGASPSPSASGSPRPSASPSASGSPRPSASPSATASPTGSPRASGSPAVSPTPSVSSAPSATLAPVAVTTPTPDVRGVESSPAPARGPVAELPSTTTGTDGTTWGAIGLGMVLGVIAALLIRQRTQRRA